MDGLTADRLVKGNPHVRLTLQPHQTMLANVRTGDRMTYLSYGECREMGSSPLGLLASSSLDGQQLGLPADVTHGRLMPTRLLRETILTSERVNRLTAEQEVFYRRLMSKVDDHGLFDARPSVLRASLYPLRLDSISDYDCSQSLTACVDAGLVITYQVDGKDYLKVLDTRWKVRSEPKFPVPVNNRKQVFTTAPLVVDVVRSRLIEDVDVVEPSKVNPVFKEFPKSPTSTHEQVERNRAIGSALAVGNVAEAARIRGKA